MKRLYFFIFIIAITFCCYPQESFLDSNQYHLYLWGCYNQFEKKHATVKECFAQFTDGNIPVYAYPGYIDHLFSTKNYKQILELIAKVDAFLPDHLETQLTLVKTLELSGKVQDAEKRIIALQKKFPNNAEVVYGCALAYIRSNKNTEAEAVLNQYLESTTEKPMHFIFYYLKAQIAAHSNKAQEAKEHINKCLQLNPSFDQGWLFCGLLHELQGNIHEAISGYRNFLQIVGHDSAVEQQIMALMLKQQQATPRTDSRSIFEESLMLYHQRQHALALKRIDHCLQLDPTYQPARLLKLELLCAMHQDEEALQMLTQWIHKNPKEDTWYRTAHLLYQAGIQKEKILSLLEHLEKQHNHIIPVLYLADIYLKKNSLDRAQEYLKKALSLSTNTQLKAKIIYQLAIIYFNEKNYNALAQAIETGLKNAPEFAPLANLGAYYYATKGNNLTRAQALIDSALKQQKDNPHYLDTQALIWYKQGNYQKAGVLLSKLSNQLEHDFYIQKHLGKVLFKQGQKELALASMKKALFCIAQENQKEKCIKTISQWNAQ